MILAYQITYSACLASPFIGGCVLSVTSHTWHNMYIYNEETIFSFYRLLSVVGMIISAKRMTIALGHIDIYVYPYMFIPTYRHLEIIRRGGSGAITLKLNCNRATANLQLSKLQPYLLIKH